MIYKSGRPLSHGRPFYIRLNLDAAPTAPSQIETGFMRENDSLNEMLTITA